MPPSVHAHQCDVNAVCADWSPGSPGEALPGNYSCTCAPPRIGDGFLCYVAASPPPSPPPPSIPPPSIPWADTLRVDPVKRTWYFAKQNCKVCPACCIVHTAAASIHAVAAPFACGHSLCVWS